MLLPPGWRQSWSPRLLHVAMFGAGLLGGSSVVAAVLWLASSTLAPVSTVVRLSAFIGLVALLSARELGLVQFSLPQNRRQVPRDIFARGRGRAALHFGFEMGTGMRTYMTSAAPHVAAAGLLMLTPTFGLAMLLGAGFALGRFSVPVLWMVHDVQWTQWFTGSGRVWGCAVLAATAALLMRV